MRMHRIGAVVRADLARYRRQPMIFVWAIVIAVFAWLFARGNLTIGAGDSTAGGTRAWVTSELAMAHVFGVGTLLLHGFFTSILCGLPIVRDEELRIGPIVHTTGISRAEYAAAKLGAALLVCLGMLALNVTLAVAFNHLWPTGKPSIRGPFTAMAYAGPALMFALPTVVSIAGASFALGTRSGRAVTVFVLPVALLLLCAFVLWEWAPAAQSVGLNRALMWLDPTGYRWLQQTYLEVDRGVEFYNHAPVRADAGFVLSRLAWMAGGLGAAAWASRRVTARAPKASDRAGATTTASASPPRVSALAALGMTTRPLSTWRATLLLARCELRNLRGHAGLYLFLPVILLSVLPGALSDTGPFDSALLPTPGHLAEGTLGSLLTATVLLLLFYTVESLERDARERVSHMLLASPAPSPAFVLGRLLANLVLGLLVFFVAWLACLVIMAMHHTPSKSPVPFALVWGALGVPTLVLWVAFVGAVWCLTRRRFATYGAGLGVVMGTGYLFVKGEATWLTNWALWKSVVWSDISTLENDRAMLVSSRLFALALAALLVRVALWRFTKQAPSAMRPRAGAWRRSARAMAPFAAPPLALGLTIFGCVEAGHGGEAAREREKDYWRRNVATFKDAPSPDISRVDLKVELYPDDHRMHVHGSYVLMNRTGRPLRHVLLTVGQHMRDLAFTVDDAPAAPENRAGLYVFTPAAPLAEGASTRVGFSYRARLPDGASKNGGRAKQFILPSGVMLTNLDPTFVPVVGFRPDIGVDDDNRADARTYEPDHHEGINPPVMPSTGAPFDAHIEVTTPAAMMTNSVGDKIEETVVDGRRKTVWQTSAPVRIFNVICGRWDVARGDGAEIYFDPRHAQNVPEMRLAVESARKYYGEWFAPYPWKTLKLSEFAGLDRYAQGFPTNITFSENIGFLADPTSDDHLPFWITAHEAAHQWWPNIVMPAEGPGAPVLSEGLSHFSAMLLVEQVKGAAARQALARRLEHHYAKARVADAEQPLTRVDAEGKRKGIQTVWYDRGGWAFWMLMRAMGRDEMFRGLHAFVGAYRDNPDHPTLHDFLVTLRPHAKDAAAYDDAVRTWFESVTLPAFQLEGVEKRAQGSAWVVSGSVRNAGSGDVSVDVGVRGVRGETSAKTTVRVSAPGVASFAITTAEEPREVVVDPDVDVLQIGRKGARRDL